MLSSKSTKPHSHNCVDVNRITSYNVCYTKLLRWKTSLTALFFVLLFAGASAGSTAGGIKLIRHVVFVKNSVLEFKRLLHPKAVIRLKMNKEIVPARILTHILVFLLIYLGVFVIGSIVVSGLGMDFLSATSALQTLALTMIWSCSSLAKSMFSSQKIRITSYNVCYTKLLR